ncbi:MAG: transposase [Anaerolineaceae bacterium]
MKYRRSYAMGGTFFFTIVPYQRSTLFIDEANVGLLIKAIEEVRKKLPFEIIAQAIMPDHLHSIWELPVEDTDYPTRLRLIKSFFTRRFKRGKEDIQTSSRLLKKEQTVWQRRYWEHQIRDEKDLERHIEYIHYNPVHHGLVELPTEWKYSTFHRYVEDGLYTVDWTADVIFKDRNDVGRE